MYICIYIYIQPDLAHLIDYVNSSPPSAAYVYQWIGSALVQIMACRLFDAKPLSKPVLVYCQLDRYVQTSVKIPSKFKHFLSRKCVSNCCHTDYFEVSDYTWGGHQDHLKCSQWLQVNMTIFPFHHRVPVHGLLIIWSVKKHAFNRHAISRF